jgi:hypothetical protein
MKKGSILKKSFCTAAGALAMGAGFEPGRAYVYAGQQFETAKISVRGNVARIGKKMNYPFILRA